MLEQKMKENERRRRSTSHDIDPELMQYLDDERLAIVIQNSEFLQELRGNEDFMKTLEKGESIFTILFYQSINITHFVSFRSKSN